MTNQEFTYLENKALSANEFVKEGYYLLGWSLTPNGEVEYEDQEIVVSLSTTHGDTINLYAKWEQITYTLELYANNNTASMTSQKFKYEDTVTLTNIFSYHGYKFVGWSKEDDTSKAYDNNQVLKGLSTTNNGVVKLYAIWSEINRNDVALILNGAETNTFTRKGNVYIVKDVLLDSMRCTAIL